MSSPPQPPPSLNLCRAEIGERLLNGTEGGGDGSEKIYLLPVIKASKFLLHAKI